ncbi:MAG: biotin/lipoyl-containing protein [Acidobacteriota bacterium]
MIFESLVELLVHRWRVRKREEEGPTQVEVQDELLGTIRLPDLGEGVTEAKLVAWKVEDGALVEKDQALVEVETDKAGVELPSPGTGRLAILRPAGETARVGEVIGRLDPVEAGEPVSD